MAEAIEVIELKRDAGGRRALGTVHPDEVVAEPGAAEGSPSRRLAEPQEHIACITRAGLVFELSRAVDKKALAMPAFFALL